MSNDKDKKIKFGLFDAFILFTAILCISGIILRATDIISFSNNKSEELSPAVISFTISNMPSEYSDKILSGDILYLGDNQFGEIIGINSYNAVSYELGDDGIMQELYIPEHIDLKGQISIYGIMTEKGFMLNGNQLIYENGEYMVQNNICEASIKIISVEII